MVTALSNTSTVTLASGTVYPSQFECDRAADLRVYALPAALEASRNDNVVVYHRTGVTSNFQNPSSTAMYPKRHEAHHDRDSDHLRS